MALQGTAGISAVDDIDAGVPDLIEGRVVRERGQDSVCLLGVAVTGESGADARHAVSGFVVPVEDGGLARGTEEPLGNAADLVHAGQGAAPGVVGGENLLEGVHVGGGNAALVEVVEMPDELRGPGDELTQVWGWGEVAGGRAKVV